MEKNCGERTKRTGPGFIKILKLFLSSSSGMGYQNSPVSSHFVFNNEKLKKFLST